MGKQLVISVMSKDRPGIIADITTVIFDLGGDLADLNQSVLGGYFTMLLIAEFDEKITPEDLFAGFSHIKSKTKLEAIIKEMKVNLEVEKSQLPKETFIITGQGDNRKGLVKILGDFFYSHNINVLDLVTTREVQKYTMIFQVDLTHIASLDAFREKLRILGEEEKLNLFLQHNDIFMATNEVGTQFDTIIAD
jgi:glycine cleavage system transcriptional repressor